MSALAIFKDKELLKVSSTRPSILKEDSVDTVETDSANKLYAFKFKTLYLKTYTFHHDKMSNFDSHYSIKLI